MLSTFSMVRRHIKKYGLKSLVFEVFLVVCILGFLSTGAGVLWFVTLDIPSVDNFHTRRVAQSTKIYDRTGKILLYDVHGNIRRTVVPLEDISRNLQNATIAIEDAEFYQHKGFRPKAFLRAVLVNLRIIPGIIGQGGSTLTQQVVKNTLLTSDKTLTRKFKEIIIAIKLEQVLSKEQILSIYLNEMPYGGTIYGAEEASGYFFGKSANELSLTESAYIAALPQAPTYYSPYGNHRDALDSRKNLVLQKMYENGFITKDELESAKLETVTFVPQEGDGIKAPHFVFYVREYLEATYGANAVNEDGLTVITTLDWDLQAAAQDIVHEYAISNEERFNAENAALVAIDPHTGQILTMVGSRDYFDESIDGNFNVALGKRQPGSSFKPFVYATAFMKGYTPETILYDLRTQFSTSCNYMDIENSVSPCYSPQNYDHKYRGPMTLRDALAQSVNIPAVKVLHLVGINEALKTAASLGITTLSDAARYGLTLVLGGGEVTLLEMTTAYSVFAADGVLHPHTAILSITDSNGKEVEKFEESDKQVLDSQVARQISSVLSDNAARTPLYGANSPLYFGESIDVAAKTGTTNDNKDAWVIGYATSIVAGAWAGNNIPEPMNQISGLIVTPLWRAFMDVALQKYPPEQFPNPEPTGTELPPILLGVWNTPGSDGMLHSILYWINKNNPRGGRPVNPASDPQYAFWEYPVALWQGVNGYTNQTGTPQTQSSPQGGIPFFITTPSAGSVLKKDQLATIDVFVSPSFKINQVSYYLNGVNIGTATHAPYSISVILQQQGQATIRAVASGPDGNYTHQIPVVVQ